MPLDLDTDPPHRPARGGRPSDDDRAEAGGPGTGRHRAWLTRCRRSADVVVLAVLAYVPALAAAPGRMPADSKLYLYLDPRRLVSDAFHSFDPRQFGGWVPHQHIAYLWPSGPWFSVFEIAGVADWIAHRLWLGTLLFAAGLGVRWAARLLGLSATGALAAALVYQLSPYVLPYTSRTSVMLLPWAGLGWIVGLTVLAATRSRWRHAAGAALVVLTVGAVNATALAMIVPAPVLWLVHAAWSTTITWRRAVATAARIAVLSTGVSLWWMAALVIQGRYGADVLAYSESLEAVSFTSQSTEVLRGLGYWLFYLRDAFAATTSASFDYLVSAKAMAISVALLVVCVLGLVVVRWTHRRYAALLVASGVILAVGVHPIDDQSPLMAVLVGDARDGLALALRSSTRAVPVSMFGLALAAGALVTACQGRMRWQHRSRPMSLDAGAVALALVATLAIANLPALWTGAFVDPSLERDQHPPEAWLDAAADLDAGPSGARVLQLPGAEFGAFRWGYTVDAPLPGLTERPMITRDLLPLGSAPMMDLLYALDDAVQRGTLDPPALAPVARLLGVDTIWLTNDHAFERFRTARPDVVASTVLAAPGLGEVTSYGPPVANVPSFPMLDEQAVLLGGDPRPAPAVQLVGVTDPVPIVRAKHRSVVVAGNGDGIVDAAAAGLVDGTELVRYAASLDTGELAAAVEAADLVVVTDSNRVRARHWRSSQDVTGFTEDGGPLPALLEPADGDARLPVFDLGGVERTTTAIQVGPVLARASSYGEPFAHQPERRAWMAVDGDPDTAWTVADRFDATGERLELTVVGSDLPTDGRSAAVERMVVRQPDTADGARRITRLDVHVGDHPVERVTLDERSLTGQGQVIPLPATTVPTVITLTIAETWSDPASPRRDAAVGFAEVDLGLGPTREIVRVPVDALERTPADTSLAIVLSRERVRPTNRWRSDPEPYLARSIELAGPRVFDVDVDVRLDQRASDEVLADLFGIQGATATTRLAGSAASAASSLIDGDSTTAWTSSFDGGLGTRLSVPLDPDRVLTDLTVVQPLDRLHSRIDGVTIRVDGGEPSRHALSPGPDGRSEVRLAPQRGARLEVEITGIEPRITVDRRYGDPVVLPVSISALEADALPTIRLPESLDTGCRSDLVDVDGRPIPLRVVASVDVLRSGQPVRAERCDTAPLSLLGGTHVLTTAPGHRTGLHVDRVVLRSSPSTELATPLSDDSTTTARVTSWSRTSRTVELDGCSTGCWLVLGEGYSPGWTAAIAGVDLGQAALVDAGSNGWELPPLSGPATVELRWTPQPVLTWSLVASAAAVLVCLGLVVGDRHRRPVSVAHRPRLATRGAEWSFERSAGSRGRLVAVAVGWTVVAALVVAPRWGLVAALVGALVVVLRAPRLPGLVAVAITTWCAVVMVQRVASQRPYPDAGWVLTFADLHRPGLFLATALAAGALLADRSEPDRPPDPARPDHDPPDPDPSRPAAAADHRATSST